MGVKETVTITRWDEETDTEREIVVNFEYCAGHAAPSRYDFGDPDVGEGGEIIVRAARWADGGEGKITLTAREEEEILRGVEASLDEYYADVNLDDGGDYYLN